MENGVAKVDKEIISKLVLEGDLSKMNAEQKTTYYGRICQELGLNPYTRPFQLLKLSGKEVMYATKDCTEQLRKIHGVSITDISTQNVGDVFVVTVKAMDKTGRTDAATGAVTVGNLKGDHLANALMKAETKAKRRVTLSICGLGMLDEVEIETIPGAEPIEEKVTDGQLALIESLIHSSTIDDVKKARIENEMFDYSQERAEKCITYLKENQKETLTQEFERKIKNED